MPEGWAAPYHVDGLHTLLIFVGIPVLLFVLIAAAGLPAVAGPRRAADPGRAGGRGPSGSAARASGTLASCAGRRHRRVQGRWRKWPLVTFSAAERLAIDQTIRDAETLVPLRVLASSSATPRASPRALRDPAARHPGGAGRAASWCSSTPPPARSRSSPAATCAAASATREVELAVAHDAVLLRRGRPRRRPQARHRDARRARPARRRPSTRSEH